MLVAPFALPPPDGRSLARNSRGTARRPLASLLIVAWLLVGSVAFLLVPAARGDATLGATLPFWLVAAPLIDLAWIHRRGLARRIAISLRALAPRVRPTRNVSRQRFARAAAAACTAARS
jgi:hypothetical protein